MRKIIITMPEGLEYELVYNHDATKAFIQSCKQGELIQLHFKDPEIFINAQQILTIKIYEIPSN